jgi:putative ABC transport system substrate-binding protein
LRVHGPAGVVKGVSPVRQWSLLLSLVLIVGCGISSPSTVSTKLYRIGWLAGSSQAGAAPQIDGFRQAMRDLGYIEGQNFSLDVRYADGQTTERDPALAAELVALKPDVLVVRAVPEAQALMKATTSIPIVLAGPASDPVADGLAASLGHPGGNVTGTVASGLSARRLQVIKEAVPTAARIAYLVDVTNPAIVRAYEEMRSVAPGLGVEVLPIEVRAPEDVATGLNAAERVRLDAIVVGGGPILSSQRARTLEFVAANHLPSITGDNRAYVDAGALMYYNVDESETYRTTARFVDLILKGANPASLPIEQPSKYVLIINLKTAKALGLTIPASVLAQATELIQ